MCEQINVDDIYNHNINFIIGSGASFGLFPTLALKVKDNTGKPYTIETLATKIEQSDLESPVARQLNSLLFMYYHKTCIEPIIEFDLDNELDSIQKTVIDNYKIFIGTILTILNKRGAEERKLINIFTTNYDGCFAFIADQILKSNVKEFTINDGSSGFRRRVLHVKNFQSYIRRAGIFDRQHIDIPQINLIHLHGSVYWSKDDESILVDYQHYNDHQYGNDIEYPEELLAFSELLDDDQKTYDDLLKFNNEMPLNEGLIDDFWRKYKTIPVVNPTKWKFHETVFEEHYYQMLREMSYELEKPNTVFISFGFSFADEHILNLVKRSLSNPQLRLFICCFNELEKNVMEEKFSGYDNVQYITNEKELNFTTFNKEAFTLQTNQSTSKEVD